MSVEQEQPAVIAERQGWRVVSKPAGWHSVGRGGAGAGAERGEAQASLPAMGAEDFADAGAPTVEAWLRERFPEHAQLPEAGLVHRLDLGTSGCLLAARTAADHDRLRAAMGSAAGVRKTYLALVRGGIADEGTFRLYFSSRHKGSRKVTVRREGTAPECGRCRWRVVRRAADGAHDLVEVELVGRGRRHQVRAGLAWVGHPLAGDWLYGGDGAEGDHPALHAWRVELDGEAVESPAPARFGSG